MKIVKFIIYVMPLFLAELCAQNYVRHPNFELSDSDIEYSQSNISLDEDSAFYDSMSFIKSQYFEISKLNSLMEYLNTNSVSSKKVQYMLTLLSFDDTREILASYAILKVVDPAAFSVCKESFLFNDGKNFTDKLIIHYNHISNQYK